MRFILIQDRECERFSIEIVDKNHSRLSRQSQQVKPPIVANKPQSYYSMRSLHFLVDMLSDCVKVQTLVNKTAKRIKQ